MTEYLGILRVAFSPFPFPGTSLRYNKENQYQVSSQERRKGYLQLPEGRAVRFVLLPASFLAVFAAVVEGLALAAPQSDLALSLLPAVRNTIDANIFHEKGKHASVGGHLHCRQALERSHFKGVEVDQGGVCHEEKKASPTRKVVHHDQRSREHF